MEFHVLAVGDITGAGGLKSVKRHLRALKKLHHIEFCVVNGENASGVGITPQQADQMLDAGADVITLGNHTWNRREIVPTIWRKAGIILRPANFPAAACRAAAGACSIPNRAPWPWST